MNKLIFPILMPLCILIFTVSMFSETEAQSIKGRLIYEVENEKVPAVNIEVCFSDSQDDCLKKTITDYDGNFYFEDLNLEKDISYYVIINGKTEKKFKLKKIFEGVLSLNDIVLYNNE